MTDSQQVCPAIRQAGRFTASVSAHHGSINAENQLQPALQVLEKYPEIDLIEIDFVYNTSTQSFVSSHDYTDELMEKGSSLSEWIEAIIPLKKTLWIDIKDNPTTMFGWKIFSKFNTKKFSSLLFQEEAKWTKRGVNLYDHIIVGCQWEWLYQDIIKLFGKGVCIVHDLPYAPAYVGDIICGRMCESAVNESTQIIMLRDIKKSKNMKIVCIDHAFFNDVDDLKNFLESLPDCVEQCILYSYKQGEPYPQNLANTNLKLIIQYDFKA